MPIHPSSIVRVRVPAKVNLLLAVGPLRDDGFHELVTVFHAVDLVDEVVAAAADNLGVTVTGEGSEHLPTDDGNIAWRAARLLADTAGLDPHVRLDLHKAIPVAGGMAGGPANAAGALLACARLWGLDVGLDDLIALAGRLGSDVAFPLLGGTAIGRGRGDLLELLPTPPSLHWVFALADFGLPTPAVYAEFDRLGGGGLPAGVEDELVRALAVGDVARIAGALGNDLQPAALALRPQLRSTLDAGLDAGALAGIVSGSGPTCAFLCIDAAAATVLAAELETAGVCRTARTAAGPAPGAAVLDLSVAG